jgi:hypothetical protein
MSEKALTPDDYIHHSLHPDAPDYDACSCCRGALCSPACCSSSLQAFLSHWLTTLLLLGVGAALAFTFVDDERNSAFEQLTVSIAACAASAVPAAAAYSRAACLSPEFVQCDNDLPVGPEPPYTLTYRQPTSLVGFQVMLIGFTLAVALLLLNVQAQIQRRHRIASALLPFYRFYRAAVPGSWRLRSGQAPPAAPESAPPPAAPKSAGQAAPPCSAPPTRSWPWCC